MDSRTGEYGTYDEMVKKVRADGRNPLDDLVEINGPPDAIERVSRAVAAHKPNRKDRRKAQRQARKRNRGR